MAELPPLSFQRHFVAICIFDIDELLTYNFISADYFSQAVKLCSSVIPKSHCLYDRNP